MRVTAIGKKSHERLLGRFGFVMRRDENHITRDGMELVVDGIADGAETRDRC